MTLVYLTDRGTLGWAHTCVFASVQVKGALDAVFVEESDKALVVYMTVIVAEGDYPFLAAGVDVELNHSFSPL